MILTDHRLLIIFRCRICSAAVQIALQNYLSCYLIDVAARVPRLFTRITQCAVCCDRSQPLIPGDDWAWQNRAQLFYKLEGFGRGRADLAIHSFG